MDVTPLRMVTFKLAQSANTVFAMGVLPVTTFVKLVQFLNAEFPMDVTLAGIVMLFKLLQL